MTQTFTGIYVLVISISEKNTVSPLAIKKRPTTYGTSWTGFVSSNTSQLRVGNG